MYEGSISSKLEVSDQIFFTFCLSDSLDIASLGSFSLRSSYNRDSETAFKFIYFFIFEIGSHIWNLLCR